MSTAAVSVPPVLTPQTISALAEALEKDHLPELAGSLRKLQPFVEYVVERCFVPLSSSARRAQFAARFTRLARDFEPFRFYLNFRLLGNLQNQSFVGVYERILKDVLGSLLAAAHEMEMAPELLSAVLRDYLMIIRVLSSAPSAPVPQGPDLTVEQFSALVDWFHSATRLDYALTATFLVLGGSIPEPTGPDKAALLRACERTLLEFAGRTSRFAAGTPAGWVVRDLETARLGITAAGQRRRGISTHARGSFRSGPELGSFRRQTEFNWLARNRDLSERNGGQWIVVEKDELIATDRDYQKARDAATRRGIKRPFIIFVPPGEAGGFMGI